MSYPEIKENFLDDLLRRKEFYSLKADPARDYRDPPGGLPSPGILADKYLKLHSHQLFVSNFLSPDTPYKRLHLLHGTGCHGAGTGVLLYNGRTKRVEDVNSTDVLMGDDGTPRYILRLLQGVDSMYKITLMQSGETFTCNHDHVLTLWFYDKIVDIPIGEFIHMPAHVRNYAKMYRRGAKLARNDVKMNPYVAAVTHDHSLPIDECYKYNSYDVHLSFINGISGDKITGDDKFLDDVMYIARCAGLRAIKQGDCLTIDDSLDMEKFKIEYIGCEEYYGFSLNANGRYLLDNFIVTHNSGKTLGAISIASKFINVYKRMYQSAMAKIGTSRRFQVELDKSTPSVFVLGFSGAKGAFMRELLNYPEFGFISIMEHEELLKRKRAASSGLTDDVRQLKDFVNMIKRRIQNKTKDGFYKFYGYDEFVNRLFISETMTLTDIESDIAAKHKEGVNVTLEDAIKGLIADGTIRVNTQLLAQFENSLIICDEIHNTYNMSMKNNRGVAIQYVLDSVPSVRFVSMSATPINNSPTEVVELINYLNTGPKVMKGDLFTSSHNLAPDALKRIAELTYGKVSFLQKVDLKFYPKKEFKGEDVRLPDGTMVPYLKFIKCPMSALHQATYVQYVNSEQRTDISTYHSVPTDGYSIFDIAFPNPSSEEYGLFRSSDTRNKINGADQEWKDKHQISIKRVSSTSNIITGSFLQYENIGKYSTKLRKLLEILTDITMASEGDPLRVQKVMIYHNRVKMSGVMLVQELLKENGYIDEYTEPIDNTRCCVCNRARVEHEETSRHQYIPARFVIVHSDVDEATRVQSLDKFNAPENLHGHNFQLLVGSKIMKESFDIKDTQNLIVMSLPTDIPTLIQVFGRCIRTNSHIRLPLAQRKVDIYMLLSIVDESLPYTSKISPELARYVDKLADYKIIQTIERVINQNALDADLHYDITMNADMMKNYFPPGATEPVAGLGNLYFEPGYKIPTLSPNELNLSTFTAYKHYNLEIKSIIYIIKRLFTVSPVYTYDQLMLLVKTPPVGIEINPGLFSEGNFIIALDYLATPSQNIISVEKNTLSEIYFMERLFDPNEKYIYIRGEKYKIEQVDKYYILFPIISLPDLPINMLPVDYGRGDKEKNIIQSVKITNEKALMDVETYLRFSELKAGMRISVDNFIKHSRENINYGTTRTQFIDKYISATECEMITMLTEYSAKFQQAIIEEIIESRLKGVDAGHLEPLYAAIMKLYDKFKVILYNTEIAKYKDTVKQFHNGMPKLPNNTPIGYLSAKSVRICDIEDAGRWFEVSKVSLNRHVTYKENNIIVGFLEDGEDHMKFKLRKPIQFIREDIKRDIMAKKSKSETDDGSYYSRSYSKARAITGDTRLVERGIVCSTKGKYELLRILASLGVSVSKLERGQIRIKRLCWLIKLKLIENEIRERQRDSNVKYLYSWFDQLPALS